MCFIDCVSHCCLKSNKNCAMPSYLALYLFKVIKNHKYLWTAFFFLFFPPSGFNCFLRFLLFRFSLCPPSVIQEIETRRELSFLFLFCFGNDDVDQRHRVHCWKDFFTLLLHFFKRGGGNERKKTISDFKPSSFEMGKKSSFTCAK